MAYICFSLTHADVSYIKTPRDQLSPHSLPVHITLVGCYNYSETLLRCDYHEFPSSSTTFMDISINCSSDSTGEHDELLFHTYTMYTRPCTH